MSEVTKLFRLKPGFKHWNGRELIKEDETVELTEAQAHAFSDRFVPVEDGFDEPPMSEDRKPTESEDEILKGNVGDVQEAIGKIDAIDKLTALAIREQEGANRKGVLNAINRRLEELSA